MIEKNISQTKLRQLLIIKDLFSYKHFSYEDLSSRFFVSKSSIFNDFIKIKEFLSLDNLSIKYDNSGSYIVGSELDIQKSIRRILTNEYDEEILSIFIDIKLLNNISEILNEIFIENHMNISSSNFEIISLSIAILAYRGKSGYTIDKNNNFEYEIAEELKLQMYPIIYKILNRIEKREIYEFSKDDTKYISKVVFASGFRYFINQEDIPEYIETLVNELVILVSNGLQIDFTKDKILYENLAAHLYQSNLKKYENIKVKNPFLDEIRKNYASIYGIVWLSIKNIDVYNQYINFSDDEIGFLTLHFLVSMEKQKSINKIIYICPYGIGLSNLARTTIKNLLSNLDYFEVIPYSVINTIDFSDVDMIITSEGFDLPESVKNQCSNIIKVSPIMTKKDISKILENYTSIVIDKKLKKRSNKNTYGNVDIYYAIRSDIRNSEDLINQITLFINEDNTKKKSEYIKSLIKREKLHSTYIGNGFTIPHGNPKLIDKSSIFIFFLTDKIDWFGNDSDIIIFLVINDKDSDKIESLMEAIFLGVQDRNIFKEYIFEKGVKLNENIN